MHGSTAALVAQMGMVQVDASEPGTPGGSRHYLSIRYPAPHLHQDGAGTRLDWPLNVNFRKRPDTASCHVEKLKRLHVAQLTVQRADVFGTGSLFQGELGRLLEAIQTLRSSPGNSFLHGLSYHGLNGIAYRLRLSNDEAGHHGMDFDFEGSIWEALMAMKDQEDWISLLHDLVNQVSDIAFFAVQQNLEVFYGLAIAQIEQEPFATSWALQSIRSPVHLLFDRLQPLTDADARLLHSDADAEVDVRFPCGCERSIRKIKYLAMSKQACLYATCRVCGASICQPSDLVEAEAANRLEEAADYKDVNDEWKSHDRQRPSSTETRRFAAKTLLESVFQALGSLEMPKAICHPHINPTEFVETKAVMAKFTEVYGDSDLVSTNTPMEVVQSLFSLACSALNGGVNDEEKYPAGTVFGPPGYAHFLMLWLDRAVNFYVEWAELDTTDCDEADVSKKLEEDFAAVQEKMGGMEID